MSRPLLVAVLASTLVLSAGVVATAPAKPAEGDSARVVFENEKVRCILYHTNSGKNVCGFGMHSHPAHLYIQIQPGKFRVTTPDGKEQVVEAPAGDVGWEPAVTHRVEAVAGGSLDTYLIEVKDKDWKPSNHLSL